MRRGGEGDKEDKEEERTFSVRHMKDGVTLLRISKYGLINGFNVSHSIYV